MFIDIALILVVLGFGLMGLFQGMIVQLARLGGLVAIYFFARFGAEPAGELLSVKSGINPLASYYIALVVGSLLAYMICIVTGLIIHRIVSGAETTRKINRSLGGGLGLLRGLAVAFIVAAALDMAAPAAAEKFPDVSRHIEQSLAVQWVHPMNPLVELGFMRYVPDMRPIARSEPAREYLDQQPPVIRLRNHPKVKAALEDPEVRSLMEERDIRGLLQNPKIRDIIFDREIRDILNSPEMQKAIQEARQKANGTGN